MNWTCYDPLNTHAVGVSIPRGMHVVKLTVRDRFIAPWGWEGPSLTILFDDKDVTHLYIKGAENTRIPPTSDNIKMAFDIIDEVEYTLERESEKENDRRED